MPLEYKSGQHMYRLSYQELKSDYHKYCKMSDAKFKKNILNIIHFCCVVGYLKECSNGELIADQGLIHSLTHIKLDIEDTRTLQDIRHQFENLMKLA